jgi:ATP-dependent Lon protease
MTAVDAIQRSTLSMRPQAQDPMSQSIETADEITSSRADEEQAASVPALPGQHLPDKLVLIPVSGRPFFPAQVQPVIVDAEPWHQSFAQVAETDHHLLGLIYVPDFDADSTPVEAFPSIATVVRPHHPHKIDNNIQFIAEGLQRFRILHWISRTPPYLVQVQYLRGSETHSDETQAYAIAIIEAIKELLPLSPLYGEELKQYLKRFSPNQPSPLTDFAATLTTATSAELQQVLETENLLQRMEKVLLLLRKEVQVARLQHQISEEVGQKVGEQQRQFFLREQLKVIQRELGLSKDDRTADSDEFKRRLQALVVPPHAEKKINDELHKLSILDNGSPEYGVTRNYLDWATSVPWGRFTQDQLDLKQARRVLDSHHDGLDDVKKRIIEFLAIGAYKGEIAGSILLLVGPPGVGKTSIGQSIASALGRKFYRFSLGGMRDEAEIKGHRRTYIGAMPGKLVQALKEVEVSNPVILLDEIDKIGASYQGDPASALLEVLDPEQNSQFLDHYLDLRLDLSKVLFICTANQLDTIPPALLDRMETIRLAGYITAEKLSIARHHLWPKQLAKAGLKAGQCRISDAALRRVIEDYAREAGVRHLEQQLARIIRKVVVELLESPGQRFNIGVKDVERHLGGALFRPDQPIRQVGVVTGLAWTALGGATLPIEACRVHAKGRGFKLTGKLGEVMQESANIAYSHIDAQAVKFGIDPEFFSSSHIHLHVPEGATPKDGPSAGITLATALVSLASGRNIDRPLAMTGELTLTGQVLPVGGIREKVVAAKRARIAELILPEANRRDFDELPDYLRDGMKVHFVRQFSEIPPIVFAPAGRSRS